MNVLIIHPGDEPRLERVARDFERLLAAVYRGTVVNIVPLDAFTSPDLIEGHDVIVIGTPTIKHDIYWPLQVAVDAMAQKVSRARIAKKVALGFTVSDSLADSSRNIEGLLWVFSESGARVLDPLILAAVDPPEVATSKVKAYVDGLAGVLDRHDLK